MKILKRILTLAAAGAMALAVLTGCAGSSSKFTLQGTVTVNEGGQTVIADAPITMASDGKATYTKYEYNGSTYESLISGTDAYEKTYATGTSGTKWTKSTVQASSSSSSSTATTGTMTIDGTEYQTQTYDNITYYCTENGKLKYLYQNDGQQEITIKIDSLSADVDSSLFTVPADSEVEAAA